MTKNILLFGGSGFVGSDLSNYLLQENYKISIICRNKKNAIQNISNHKNLKIINIDIFDQNKLENLIKDYDIIINLIGKLFEEKKNDFDKFHHKLPELLSKTISNKQHFIHISALAIENSAKTSIYAKSKLNGEKKIIENCKNYNIIKPSIIFGKKDNFFNQFARMAKISPFLPIIGDGNSKFSPIYVKDLNKFIIFLIENNRKYQNKIFEAAGNDIVNFRNLMQFILKTINKKRFLLNLPFPIAKLQAKFLNFFKIYLLTSDQVELLKYDNIASNKYDNINKIIGKLHSYKDIVPKYCNKK
jgi:nucleoside-diphosphate-sugar epimerase